MVALALELIVGLPVAPDGKDLVRALLKRNDIGEGNTLVVIIPELVVLDDEIDLHLQQLVAVVGRGTEAEALRNLLLNLVECAVRLSKLHVTVEAITLKLFKLIGRLAHHVGHTLSSLKVRGSVGHHNVVSGHEHRHLTAQRRVVIDLLERVTRKTQAPQHPLVLGPILRHDVGQLVVHVILDAACSVALLRRLFTDDLRPHRPLGRERLHHGLSLELDDRLSEKRVIHTTGTRPRLGAVLDLHPQQF